MPIPRGDPDLVMRAILSGPIYRASTNGHAAFEQTPWERIKEWLAEHLLELLSRLSHQPPPVVRNAGTAFGVLLGIFVVVALLRVAIRWGKRLLGAAGAPAESEQGSPPRRERGVADWQSLSVEEAARGRYGAAVSALFMAALRLLDERSLLAFDPARTPNEYRRRVADLIARAAAPFDELAGCFVRAVYGSLEPERALYDGAARAYASFTTAVEG